MKPSENLHEKPFYSTVVAGAVSSEIITCLLTDLNKSSGLSCANILPDKIQGTE